jgi:hypothetical protein
MGEAESGTVFVGRFATVELDPLCLAARTTTEGLVGGDVSVSPFLSEEAALLGLRDKKEANVADLFCKITPTTTSPRVNKLVTTLNLNFNKQNHTPIKKLSK